MSKSIKSNSKSNTKINKKNEVNIIDRSATLEKLMDIDIIYEKLFKDKEVSIFETDDGEIYFYFEEVLNALNYSGEELNKEIGKYKEKERFYTTVYQTYDGEKSEREEIMTDKIGLYHFILECEKEEAKEFKEYLKGSKISE